jgi:GNAT superfamily N-acetyltransferase
MNGTATRTLDKDDGDPSAGTRVTIEEFAIPATLEAPGGTDFRRMVQVRNAIEVASAGTVDLQPTAEQLIQAWNNFEFEPKRMFLAREDGDIVGRGTYEWQPEGPPRIAFLAVEVLPQHRRTGIGAALLRTIESAAAADGRSVFQAWALHGVPGGATTISPPTGFGTVDADRPEVRFLRRHGYSLEQVERVSKLTFPVAEPSLQQRFDTAAGHADGYRIESWVGDVPERWVDDLAYLHSRMVTDAPSAALEFDEEDWTPARVAKISEQVEAAGDQLLSVAAIDAGTDRAVGFSNLVVPSDASRPAVQEDTLVVREHRGHRLGTLLKIANLQQLQRISPRTPSVTTFNAEENRPMLDVNEAVGFVPIGSEGAWKKTV